MQVIHFTDADKMESHVTLKETAYILPIALWTSLQTIAMLPEFLMAAVFGVVTCEQSQSYSTCFEIFSITASVAGVILANIYTVVLCFMSEVNMLKKML